MAGEKRDEKMNGEFYAGALWRALWPVFAFGVAITGGYVLFEIVKIRYKNHRRERAGFEPGMSPIDFVHWTAKVFRHNGYQVKVTEGLEDRGADLVLSKDGKTIVVQVKHWKKDVGMSAVREIVASIPVYKADSAAVACSRDYTNRAVELAKANRVQLYSLDRLLKMAPDSSVPKDVK